MDDEWGIVIIILLIALVLIGLIASVFYYNVIKLEHQTERLSTLEGMDRCLYLCGDVNRQYSEQRLACFEKCEDSYVNLETLKMVQNG